MNVLADESIRVERSSSEGDLSLPDVIANLLTGSDISDFPHLGPDQRSYWWRFLVRCGARALRTAELSVDEAVQAPGKELSSTVKDALLEHSELHDWELCQAEPQLPGFLQSPTPSGKSPEQEGYRESSAAILTAIIGTKEHERKSGAMRVRTMEELVYALVEYQGGVIFGGRGNYESQIMGSRSGAGSGTPFMGVLLDRSLALTYRHDVAVLLRNWDLVRDERGLQGTVWALWRLPWDGTKALPAHELDPAFIPYARMVRVGQSDDGTVGTVWFKASKGSRVSDHTEAGHLGDPFTPLVPHPKKDGQLKVRGTLQSGYDYREVVKLLVPSGDDEARRSPTVGALLSHPPVEDLDLRVIFEGTAFEQGKTRGFHRRVIRLPLRAVRKGLFGHRIEPIHHVHRAMLEDTGSIARRALTSGISVLLIDTPKPSDDLHRKASSVLMRFDDEIDRRYLEFLFRAAEQQADGDEEWRRTYRKWLYRLVVGDLFPFALRSLPRNAGRRFEQEVKAEAYLSRRLRRDFDLFEKTPNAQKPEVA